MTVTRRSVVVIECSKCTPIAIGYVYNDEDSDPHKVDDAVSTIVGNHEEEHAKIDERIARVLATAKAENQALSAATGVELKPVAICLGETCMVEIGEEHHDSCDVARCMVTGTQRKLIDHIRHLDPQDRENHKCGQDVWIGYMPGEYEAAKYGTTINDVMLNGSWDPEQMQWVMPERAAK